MGNRIGEKIKLTSIDELLCVPETVGTVEIELGLISEFANHPFRVVDDEKMDELVESIRQQGILSPVLVRPGKDSGYEMVSGHRRLHAAGIVGLKKIPAIVRELNDDEAVIAMVNANLQREEILPSERGFSLKMKMDAMRHQGTCRHDVDKLSPVERKTATIVGEGSGLTGRSVQRYIRLEKLVRTGFVERRGDKKTKYLVPTHKGEALITVIPEAIQSASMTAEWEQKLLEIEKGDYSSNQFMKEIEGLITTLIDTYEVIPDAEVLMHPVYMPLGKCPHCGKDVIEKSKGFFCSDKECKFALWKENRLFDSLSKKMTKQIAEQLLKNGKAKLKKCRSVKTGKTYDCTVVLSVNDVGQAQFNLEFDNQGKK